jgi:hypothetical protein
MRLTPTQWLRRAERQGFSQIRAARMVAQTGVVQEGVRCATP